ncbi:MAG: manganese efflux pump MntP family protein [Planctomycetota bacterium]
MDAFTVAISVGITLRCIGFRQYFRLAWHFGLFQMLMPVLGWCAGTTVQERIADYDHWIAFGLLVFVAQGMLRSAFSKGENRKSPKDPTKGATMVMLSVATSLDALAVGLSLSMINVSIWMPSIIIGVVACLFTIAGLYLGKKVVQAARVRVYADSLGAVVLLIIGINILREHGVFDEWF